MYMEILNCNSFKKLLKAEFLDLYSLVFVFTVYFCPFDRNLSSNELKTVTKETFQGLNSLEYM